MQPKAPCARCDKCPLKERPFVPTYVPPAPNGVMFIGEAPGAEEIRDKIPFVGASGQLLQREYVRAGGNFDAAIRTNAVLCRPRQTPEGAWTPSDAAIAACAPRLRNEIRELAPEKIVTLGKVPARIMSVLHGKSIEEGVQIDHIIGAPHPAFILRRPSELPRLQRVLRRILGNEDPESLDVLLREEPEVRVINELSQLQKVVSEIEDGSWVCFDIETNNLDWYDKPFFENKKAGITGKSADNILCLAFTTGVGYGWIVTDELLEDNPAAKMVLTEFFQRVNTIAHNGKFDTLFLRANGINSHVDVDTLAMHYALDETPGTHGLKELASAFFGLQDYEAKLIKQYLRTKNDDYSKIPPEALYKYAVWDVCATFALAIKFKPSLVRQGMWEHPLQALYMPALKTLTEVEWNGFMVDVPSILFWKDRFLERAEIVRRKLGDIAGSSSFNPGSTPQCQKLLFEDIGLPRTTAATSSRASVKQGVVSKEGSTNKKVLEEQLKGAHPAVDLIIEYRALKHKVAAYFDNMLNNVDRGHRLHTQYLLQGTETGRLSSRNPALQTIPRGTTLEGRIIRSCFIAPPGRVLIDADYDQAELRVFAALTLDPFLLRVYEEGRDLHTEVTIAMYGTQEQLGEFVYKEARMTVKQFNFGWAFGAGLERARQVLPDKSMAEEFYNSYEAQMPVAAAWRRKQTALADSQKYVISRTGRKRRFPEQGYGPEAINAPVQSGASDCTLVSAGRLVDEGHMVLLLVHDELLVEVDEKSAEEKLEYVEQVMAEEGARLFPEVKWNAEGKITKRWAKRLTDVEVNEWMASGGLEAIEAGVLV